MRSLGEGDKQDHLLISLGGGVPAPQMSASLPSARQHPSYGDCLEVKREYYQNCSVLGGVKQCSQSAAHSCEQFLQVQPIGFVTLGPLRCA